MLDQKYQERLDKWRRKETPPKPKYTNKNIYIARRDYGDEYEEDKRKYERIDA